MCLSCSSEWRHEKFQKLSANVCALDSRATVYGRMNGNRIDPLVKTFPHRCENTWLFVLKFFFP